ncbi:DUF1572 family protein [Paenibacillus sp. MMS18-CY102]|uniref:DUF1572 family protein n=1 Tax=Paenibacillus sp. MMS18-CY102 TaxID=2682849 RepID=UPI001365CEDA|nr:DUF1572 family protein [Paenibacillus sp. MMS18-CY102]MWC26876.1 DUF1572 domain-containing protein [Paenibacillus sp. MMS18-CY102]
MGSITKRYEGNREWLAAKFEEIRKRILKALEQLDDEQVNWRPNDASHSISTLIKHIEGNILERIAKGILHHDLSWELFEFREQKGAVVISL